MNYGYKPPVKEPEHYVLGALGQSLPKVVVSPDGQWDAFLPKDEFQRDDEGFDTANCTAYASENAWETLIKARYGIDIDFSERDLGIRAGTFPPGNDPKTVAVTARKQGLIIDSMLPFSSDIRDAETYYSYQEDKKKRECDAAASQHLVKFSIGEEYVSGDVASMKEALKYSPLGVALYAWYKEGEVFVRPRGVQDTHWTMIYGYYDNGDWKCFDSYDYSKKRLAKDFGFTIVMRYHIEQKLYVELSVMQKFIKILQDLGIVKKKSVIEAPPVIEKPIEKPNLLDIVKQSLNTDPTPDDLTPDDVACAESLSTLIKKIYYDFPVLQSTADLDRKLFLDKRFQRVSKPAPGVIIVSPRTAHTLGHTGVFTTDNIIASNASKTGLFVENYEWNEWIREMKGKRGLRIYLYAIV